MMCMSQSTNRIPSFMVFPPVACAPTTHLPTPYTRSMPCQRAIHLGVFCRLPASHPCSSSLPANCSHWNNDCAPPARSSGDDARDVASNIFGRTQRERESMKTLRVSLLAFVATGALLGLSGGALQVRTAAADTPALRPVIGGQYCHELSRGESFVASQMSSNSLYCDPA